MTVIKIALSVLGTIGLTAGTMLAVAEPTPEPLATLPPSACVSSSCSKGTCQTSAATPVAACAASACTSDNKVCAKATSKCATNACTAEKTAPLQASEPVAAIADKPCIAKCPENACAGSACEVAKKCEDACTAKVATKSACQEKCDKLAIGSGVNSDTGVVGNIVLTSATECEKGVCCSKEDSNVCAKGKCETAVTSKEPAEAKTSRRLSIRLGLSNKGPIVQVSTGDSKSDLCETCPTGTSTVKAGSWTAIPAALVKACVSGSCGTAVSETCSKASSCGSKKAVIATACEAKAVCATPMCATASVSARCECNGCCEYGCRAGDTCCGKCEGPGCEGTQCLPTIQASTEPAAGCSEGDTCHVASGCHEKKATAGIDHFRNYDSYRRFDAGDHNPPGVVHLSHAPVHPYHLRDDIQYFAPGPDSGSPSRHWLFGADSFPSMAAGAAFENMATWPRLRMVSFVNSEAVEDALKPAKLRHPLEGKWSRNVGSTSLNLTLEGGQIQGAWHDGGDEPSIRFSGTCSVSEDGQIFGLIDDVNFGSSGAWVPPHVYNWIIDQPFAVRFRKDGDEIVLKDFRCAGMPSSIEVQGNQIALGDYIQAFVCGRFSRSE